MRQVLLGLGLEDKELSDMPDVFGVEWRLDPKFEKILSLMLIWHLAFHSNKKHRAGALLRDNWKHRAAELLPN